MDDKRSRDSQQSFLEKMEAVDKKKKKGRVADTYVEHVTNDSDAHNREGGWIRRAFGMTTPSHHISPRQRDRGLRKPPALLRAAISKELSGILERKTEEQPERLGRLHAYRHLAGEVAKVAVSSTNTSLHLVTAVPTEATFSDLML